MRPSCPADASARGRPSRAPARAWTTCALLAIGLLGLGPPSPRVDLAGATWRLNGSQDADLMESLALLLPGDPDTPDDDLVLLHGTAMGDRWATVFVTPQATTHRLALDWQPGPDGALFEIVIDGERLSPPRDGWRPRQRRLVTDLGSRWLGKGEHLLEFVFREQADARLRLHALELRAP